MKKFGWTLLGGIGVVCRICADSPTYPLFPPDGYVFPPEVKMELQWTMGRFADLPEECRGDTLESIMEKSDREYIYDLLQLDLNRDGQPELIITDIANGGTGGYTYLIYTLDPGGKYRSIGSAFGSLSDFCVVENGYLQMRFISRSGEMNYWHELYSFDPKVGSYQSERREHYDYESFTCEINEGEIPGEHPKEKFIAGLETAVRTALWRDFQDERIEYAISAHSGGIDYAPGAGPGFTIEVVFDTPEYRESLKPRNIAASYFQDAFRVPARPHDILCIPHYDAGLRPEIRATVQAAFPVREKRQ